MATRSGSAAGPRVFVLTGAGISAESGIPTFRGVNGLWNGWRIEEVASPRAFERDPLLVWRFYSERRAGARDKEPHAGHRALAELEAALGERMFLCTQNVDHLHERAGSRRVAHMHGRLFQSRCSQPRCTLEPFDDDRVYLERDSLPTCPRCGSLVRPHICWFGEVPFELERIEAALLACDLCLVVGTSGVVYPAAGFVEVAASKGARTVYIGPEEPGNSEAFDELVHGPASVRLPEVVAGLMR
ncbi:MAG TPA: NAD-dependent deacylase [Candidatus Eisenbacteria bacterium]|nr:NAD-dependent deacylase [Candidatus Eisenbacteria bacterium]